MNNKKCNHIKEDGNQCSSFCMKDSDYCFSHNPEEEERHKLASQKGGQTPKRNFNPLPPIFLDNPEDVINLLAKTINEVRAGEIDLKVANCIGYLSGHLIKAFEAADLDKRVELIEKVVLSR